MKEPHKSIKRLRHGFDDVWKRLQATGELSDRTGRGKRFIASADFANRGAHQEERYIKIKGINESEYARIFPDCWGFTTNCYGTRIGGYSEALDDWVG